MIFIRFQMFFKHGKQQYEIIASELPTLGVMSEENGRVNMGLTCHLF